MKTISIHGSSPEELINTYTESTRDGFRPTLAIIFISVDLNRSVFVEHLKQQGVQVFGASSSGEFTNGYQGLGTGVALLLDLDPSAFTILFEKMDDSAKAAGRLATRALDIFPNPSFLLCTTSISEDKQLLDGRTILHTIDDAAGGKAVIFGGMAGDDNRLEKSFVFDSENDTDQGIIAIVFDANKVELMGTAVSGWQPIGLPMEVTDADERWLYTINGQPALETYLKYLGADADQHDNEDIFNSLGLFYPLEAIGTGDPLLRTPVAIDRDKKALLLDFPLKKAEQFRFTTPPDFDIVHQVLEHAKELRDAWKKQAEGLLVFSCAGRVNSLGPMVEMENQGLCDLLNAPMAGFFSYGEYGKATGRPNEMHSTTFCWVALREISENN